MHPIKHFRRNVVAYLALFAALGTGSAYAAGQITSGDIAKNAIRSKHIKDGQVRGADLAAGAVTAAKIAPDSITGAQIDESTLQGLPIPPAPAPAAQPPAQAPPADEGGEEEPVDTVRVIAEGFLSGPGPLSAGDRCNSVGDSHVPGVGFSDHVVITPGTLTEEVVYTATRAVDSVSYMACYEGAGSVTIGADVHYMVLRVE